MTNAPDRLTLYVDTENSAFGEMNEEKAEECARILRAVADKLERGENAGTIRDANGNSCGEFILNITPA